LILRVASDYRQFMRPEIVDRIPTPALNPRNPTTCFAEPLLKNTELDYISPHAWKSILTSRKPTTRLLDLRGNVFIPNKALLLAGKKV